MSFTELEERFIGANIPVLRATEAQIDAAAQFATAEAAGVEAAEALADSEHPDINRVRELILEAARRAGYEPGSPVVAEIELGFESAQAMMNLIAEIGDEVA